MAFKENSIVVAMSGGVDSSVAAYLLKENGYDVVGVTLKMFCYANLEPNEKNCCSLEAIERAKSVASMLGVQHIVLDVSSEFKKHVVDSFVNDYISGKTPNPCVICNAKIKIPALLEFSKKLGFYYVATGHYALIDILYDNKYALCRGIDKNKDQSYFLWMIPYSFLSRIKFPIGNMTKLEVRALANKLKLCNANIPESQEICFIPNNDYISFLKSCLPASHKAFSRGSIVDLKNQIIGEHQGYACYTIGQRKGIGGGHKQKLYVIHIDPVHNVIKVGPQQALYREEVSLSNCNILDNTITVGKEIELQIRYRSEPIKGQIKEIQNDNIKIQLYTPAKAVTPGQSGVVYFQNRVLLGGIINSNAE